jgi:hypothetical protein
MPMCGVDIPLTLDTLPIASRDTALTTEPPQLSSRYRAEFYRVCYCQVRLNNGNICNFNDATVWKQLGFLHVVDMAV